MSTYSIEKAWEKKSAESFDTYQDYRAACAKVHSLERSGQKGSPAHLAAVSEASKIKSAYDAIHAEAERLRIASGPAGDRAEKVQRFVLPVLVALIFLVLFPAIGAVQFSAGIWAALFTSAVFAAVVSNVFLFALPVQILMGSNCHPKLVFYGFVTALLVIPTALVLLAGAISLITVSSIALTVLAAAITVVATWLIPTLVRMVI